MVPSSVVVTFAGLAVIGLVAAFVYRDASRLEFQRPRLWTAFVATTMLAGLLLYVFVESVPVPGLLVFVLVGLVFYLFERDDAVHGDVGADPHELPGHPGGDSPESETTAKPNDDNER